MEQDFYFHSDDDRLKEKTFIFTSMKEKNITSVDYIPKKYKRKDYIIDKLNCKKKNVEK